MNINNKILVIILSLFYSTLLFASPVDTTSVIDNIYNFNFHKASEQLLKLNEKDPLTNETLGLEIKWWKAIASEDKNHFAEFLNTLNQFEKSNKTSLSEIITTTYRMRYYACVNKDYLIPFLFLKVRFRIGNIDILVSERSGDAESELLMLYKSFLTLVQNNIFVGKVLSDSRKNQQLISNIEEVIRNGSSPNKTIGRYFLMKYYLDIENDKTKAFGYLSYLHKQYPQNMIFTQLLTN
jgi:hypothetical protein